MYLEAIFSAPDIQRQLPVETKLFILVDKSWRDIMRRTARMPLALDTCTQPGLLEQLQENNRNLDQIMKCLEAYLETKRIGFPRFFFLSNDELLEILAQTKNPHAVQRHLQKCFDAIHRLEFATAAPNREDTAATDVVLTTDIIAMISPEGEKVNFGKGLKARGNVEDWLSKVEESMFVTLRKRMKAGIADLDARGRELFLWSHPSQVIFFIFFFFLFLFLFPFPIFFDFFLFFCFLFYLFFLFFLFFFFFFFLSLFIFFLSSLFFLFFLLFLLTLFFSVLLFYRSKIN